MKEERKIYRKVGDKLGEISFMDLIEGDLFKIVDCPPTFLDPDTIWVALGDAYINKAGIGEISTVPLEE